MGDEFSVKDRFRRMSRAEVCAYHEISVSTLQLIEAAKGLTVYRERVAGYGTGSGNRERVWFDRVEVESYIHERKRPKRTRKTTLKFRTKARLSAHCFELFRRGMAWQDVVIETKADPQRVLELLETYRCSPEELEGKQQLREEERRWRQETRSREWKEFQERMAKVRSLAPPAGVSREQMAEIMMGVVKAITPASGNGAGAATGAAGGDPDERGPG
jgi:hypothetical protein